MNKFFTDSYESSKNRDSQVSASSRRNESPIQRQPLPTTHNFSRSRHLSSLRNREKVSKNRWKLSMIRHKIRHESVTKSNFESSTTGKSSRSPSRSLPLAVTTHIRLWYRKVLAWLDRNFEGRAPVSSIQINDSPEVHVKTLFKLNMSPVLKRIHLHNLLIRSRW